MSTIKQLSSGKKEMRKSQLGMSIVRSDGNYSVQLLTPLYTSFSHRPNSASIGTTVPSNANRLTTERAKIEKRAIIQCYFRPRKI